ncbi:hypothetical protein LSH36_1577g00031 [Paralvinella palmiformis]|uniref:Peptidase M14 domain-containing protein n=1 Tax=Paralvinella palmiformis TaxID=53620 RepID=A0AAD9MR22_9ANNE|nr:hypothetical protein LSH36_1577g00031 [Paralvinella palmiformis]
MEVKNVVNFLSPRAQAFMAFLTYHSYGQRFITRWDYSKDVVPTDHDQLMKVAEKAVDAMHRVHGTIYEPGRAPELMYPYGGGSPDWARAIANIKYSYLIELRDHHSFILPTKEIIPTGEENWAALKVISQEILQHYGDIPAPYASDHPSWSHANHMIYKIQNDGYNKRPIIVQWSVASGVHVDNVLIIVLWLFILWSVGKL